MKPKIYSYYESVQLRPQDEQFACANIWKSTWEAQGWDPVMLNRSHAQGSPLHLKLMTKLTRLAPVLPNELQNNFAFICARFSRWCALHAAGGGWMSDYDVANISFIPQLAEEVEKTGSLLLLSGKPSYVFHTTKEMCAHVINTILSNDLHVGGVLKNEDTIFNESGKLDKIEENLIHAKLENNIPKSQYLKNILNII